MRYKMMTKVERLDRKSKPLRDAFGEWTRLYHYGWGGGWDYARGIWRYELYGGPHEVVG
jgi:hypothetical protein